MNGQDQEPPIFSRILRAQNCATLAQLLPPESLPHSEAAIKRNPELYIQYLQRNKALLLQSIDLSFKHDHHASPYEKRLASLSADLFSGDCGEVAHLFVKADPLQGQEEAGRGTLLQGGLDFQEKYEILLYVLDYLRRPLNQISPVCMNYICKLLTYIAMKRPYQLFEYFDGGAVSRSPGGEGAGSPCLELLVELAYNFRAVSEFLAMMISEEEAGVNSRFKGIKVRVVEGMVRHLLSEDKISANTADYENLMGFVTSVFSKSRCGGDSESHQLTEATQRLVDENVIWFFKEKLIQSAQDANANEQAKSSTTINSFSSLKKFLAIDCSFEARSLEPDPAKTTENFKKEKREGMDHRELNGEGMDHKELNGVAHRELNGKCKGRRQTHREEQQTEQTEQREQNEDMEVDIEMEVDMEVEVERKYEIVFQNCLSFLLALVQRINSDEEEEGRYPALDFFVDEILYSEDSLYELLSLQIPAKFAKLSRMQFYVLLLEVTRNSRYFEEEEKRCVIRQTTLVNILIHLLKAFKREFRSSSANSMTKFYIQELITAAVLPHVEPLKPREAMLILSAFSPASSLFTKHLCVEDQSLLFKIMLSLTLKCSWYSLHFEQLKRMDLPKMKQSFATKICDEALCLHGRKFPSKQFSFMASFIPQSELRFGPQPGQKQANREEEEEEEDVFANAQQDAEYLEADFQLPPNQSQSPAPNLMGGSACSDPGSRLIEEQPNCKQESQGSSDSQKEESSYLLLQSIEKEKSEEQESGGVGNKETILVKSIELDKMLPHDYEDKRKHSQ